ncbi:MAG: heavy-metal-associated domain-containing protein [Acidimicrobiales bacterium]|jgi:copper chaperone CopZ
MSSSTTPSPTRVELSITGMHCGSCVALIEETLAEHPGVSEVSVSLEPPRADLVFDNDTVSLDDLCATVASLGYTASPTAKNTSTP